MVVIKKKIWPEFFDKIASGKKKFELRLADFELKEGDILELEEWDPKTEKYTGRKMQKKVSFLLNTKNMNFWSREEIEKYGYYVISLK
jgi:hypothetical protein